MFTRVILFSALGYFVDIYDLVLFSVLRISSLKTLGVAPDQMMAVGLRLMNWQMAGLVLGGIVSGVCADKWGRRSMLLVSIFIYSAANLANAFVFDLSTYALVRFIAGFGLAGELGTAITLVSEVMPAERRGYGTMIVAAVGFTGATAAAIVGDKLDWRLGYVVGGLMGLALLFIRRSLIESAIFHEIKAEGIKRGNLILFFKSWNRLRRFVASICLGLPIWLIAGILTPFSPEICKQLGVTSVINVGTSVLLGYAGASLGDLLSGFLSQRLRRRKSVIAIFMALLCLTVFLFLTVHGLSAVQFYALWFGLGVLGGYWAVLVGFVCEQFGTNLRRRPRRPFPILPARASFR